MGAMWGAVEAALFRGWWSPLGLVAVVVMAFGSLGLLVAGLLLGVAGRLRAVPAPGEEALPPAPGLASDAVFEVPRRLGGAQAGAPEVGDADLAAEAEDAWPGAWAWPLAEEELDNLDDMTLEEAAALAAGVEAEEDDAVVLAAAATDADVAEQMAEDGDVRHAGRLARRKTGLGWLLAGAALEVPAVMVFSWVDSPAGQMRWLTVGAVLCGLLLAGQVVCVVQLVRCQRRL